MTNGARKKLRDLYKQAKRSKGSYNDYQYYKGVILALGLNAKEYEQAIHKLSEVMDI